MTDPTPFRQKAIPYSKAEREWIREYVRGMEELGLVRRLRSGVDPDPEGVSSVVLVKEGQTQ